ncbi:L,D-transpeptidase [Halobacillus mangrovi]|uniref:L,D-transpeptidase n=1 Tax=Halobacillus mangrovi TaxID=402384 RepID=UPI003D96BBF0
MKILTLLFLIVGSFMTPHVAGEPVILVNKTTHEVTLIKSGKIVFHAKAAVGKTRELTPEGQFRIKVKAKDPYYRKKNIPGGDPENPLGSRWIGFDARGTDGRIYGIHGTNQPNSIGKSVSAGCIRLKNRDVEKLFELVPSGSDVLIVSSNQTIEELYKQWEKEKLEELLSPST